MGIMHKALSPNVSLVVAVTFLTQILPFGNAAFAFPSWQPTSPSLALVSPWCQGKGLVESNGIFLARSEGWESLNKADSDNSKTAPSNNQQGENGLFRERTEEWKPIRNESSITKPSTISQSAKGLIGTKGGTVEDAALGVQVTIGPGSLSEFTPITISSVEASPPLLESPAPEGIRIIRGPTFDFGPSGLFFKKPVQVTVSPSPQFREHLKRGEEFEVGYWNGKTWQPVLAWWSDDRGTIYFETDHFTVITTALILALGGISIVGARLGDMWLHPQQYIIPDSPKVIKHAKTIRLPDPKRISSVDRTPLNLKSFKGRQKRYYWNKEDYLPSPRITSADGETMLSQKDANCWDATNYAASVLLAKNDPDFTNFIAVAGSACCDENGKRGEHAWIEIRIKGKLYVIDTINVDNISLVPKDIAYKKQALNPGLQWNHLEGFKTYVGWDGVPGADPKGQDGHGPEDLNGTSTGTTTTSGTTIDTGAKEPTDKQLQDAYEDGRSIGCSHVNAHTSVIKEDLRQNYVKYVHPKLRLRFREGYNDGAQACK